MVTIPKYNLQFIPPKHTYSALPVIPTISPSKTGIDLRLSCPPIYEQGPLGSCTANALCALMAFDKIFGSVNITPSRLFLYYNERSMEGTIPTDAGATITDGIQSLLLQGVCKETTYPYIISAFSMKPSIQCYTEAAKYKAVQVYHVPQSAVSMKLCLMQKLPFCVGIQIFPSFETKAVSMTGIVPMPSSTEKPLGGHAVVVVGYDDIKQRWILRNSWGQFWGDKGYFYLPYAYLLNPLYAADMWAIQKVTSSV